MNTIQNVSEKEMEGRRQVSSSDPSKDVQMLVLAGDELKTVMNNIILKMEEVVSRTMGPYGKNAIVQRMNSVDITKDGYLTARALNIGTNIAEKSLCSICMDTIASTNITAGDGTSSTIKVAAWLHRHIQRYLENNFMNVRDLENTLNKAAEVIETQLLQKATKITDENIRDAIYKIALVSTNWDEDLATMFADIYEKTHNPVIKRVNSGSTKTYYEIIEGYNLAGHLILQDTYLTDFEKRTRVVERPFILVFDGTLTDTVLDALIMLSSYAKSAGIPEIVVMAKGFTVAMVNKVAAMNTRASKAGEPPVALTLIEYQAPAVIDRECVLDFCDLIGTEVIGGDSDIRGKIDQLSNTIRGSYAEIRDKSNGVQEKKSDIVDMTVTLFEELTDIAGICEFLTVGDKEIIVTGCHTDNDIIEKKKKKLELEIGEALRNATAKTMVTDSISSKQIRLGKLRGSMGIIHVGGRGTSHLKSRTDAVDDAIRACQLAYTSGGYTIGGCYAVPAALASMEPHEDERLKDFMDMISASFRDAIETVIMNKYGDHISNDMLHNIGLGIRANTAFNVITEKLDDNLIEPVMVDIAILNSALALVLTLETTDQYLYTAYENLG